MEVLSMVMCWLVCGITCMVTCLRFGIAPGLCADLTEHSAFSLACLLLWPLLVVIGVVVVVIFMTRHVLGRFSMGLAKLVIREETT